MIRYIIQQKDGTTQYYASETTRVGNRWTSIAGLATRWVTRDAATEFITSIRAVLNPEGSLHVIQIQVQEPKEY